MLSSAYNQLPSLENHQKGVMLLEGLIAIVIFSLGVIALMGLQASTMKATTQAKTRVDASLLANQRIANIWIDKANIATYAESNTNVAELPSGTRTTVINGDQVTVTINWQMPGDTTTHSFSTIARVNGNPP